MTVTLGSSKLDLDLERSWRSDNVGRLLLTGFEFFEGALMRSLERSGFTMVRHVHFNVLRHLDFKGTRIVNLASRAGITKGSMGKIVQECERLGLVELHVDPDDGRAKLVTFAPLGLKVMESIHTAMGEVHEEIAAITGKRDMEATLRALRTLRHHFLEDDGVPSARVQLRR